MSTNPFPSLPPALLALGPWLLVLALLAVFLMLLTMGAVLALLVRRLRGERSSPAGHPHEKAASLLTPAELAFDRALREAMGAKFRIYSKVRLADVITIPGNRYTPGWLSQFNRIASKHLDFVLCAPDTLEPILAVELDDSSHRRPDRQERDRFLDRICREADLPLLRIAVARRYSPEEVRRAVNAAIS